MVKSSDLAIFDFDKTLIDIDSFRAFSLFASNGIWEKFSVLFLASCAKTKLISNTKYKEFVLLTTWIRKSQNSKNEILCKLQARLSEALNSRVVKELENHKQKGHTVAIISASPSFYLEGFSKHFFRGSEVFGSYLYARDGNVRLHNLYGREKAVLVENIRKKINPQRTYFYTDSYSDLPIIRMADKIGLVKPSKKLCRKLRKIGIEYRIID